MGFTVAVSVASVWPIRVGALVVTEGAVGGVGAGGGVVGADVTSRMAFSLKV